MGNTVPLFLAWLGVAIHLGIGLLAMRRMGAIPLVPLVNAATAVAVLMYWLPRWYSYLFQGIIWYASDQVMPMYAIVVLALAAGGLAGRITATVPQWLVFGIDGLALLAAALFLTFFRMDRLI